MGNPVKEERLLTCSNQDWGRASLPVEGWEESTYFLWPDATRQTATTQSAKEQFPLSPGHIYGAHGHRYHGQASNIHHKALENVHTPPPHILLDWACSQNQADVTRQCPPSSPSFSAAVPQNHVDASAHFSPRVSWDTRSAVMVNLVPQCHEPPLKGRDEKRMLLFSSRTSRFFLWKMP